MMVKEKKPSKNKANRHAVVEDDQNIINRIQTIAFTFWVVFFIIRTPIKQVLTYAFTFWAVFFIIQIPYFEVINQVRTYVFTFWAVFLLIRIPIIGMYGRNPINRVLTYVVTYLAVFFIIQIPYVEVQFLYLVQYYVLFGLCVSNTITMYSICCRILFFYHYIFEK